MTWGNRIKLAEKNKGFTYEDKELAGMFYTCALSEHPKLQGTNYQVNKLTNKLYTLGEKFYNYVDDDNFDMAEKTRKEILRKRKVLK